MKIQLQIRRDITTTSGYINVTFKYLHHPQHNPSCSNTIQELSHYLCQTLRPFLQKNTDRELQILVSLIKHGGPTFDLVNLIEILSGNLPVPFEKVGGCDALIVLDYINGRVEINDGGEYLVTFARIRAGLVFDFKRTPLTTSIKETVSKVGEKPVSVQEKFRADVKTNFVKDRFEVKIRSRQASEEEITFKPYKPQDQSTPMKLKDQPTNQTPATYQSVKSVSDRSSVVIDSDDDIPFKSFKPSIGYKVRSISENSEQLKTPGMSQPSSKPVSRKSSIEPVIEFEKNINVSILDEPVDVFTFIKVIRSPKIKSLAPEVVEVTKATIIPESPSSRQTLASLLKADIPVKKPSMESLSNATNSLNIESKNTSDINTANDSSNIMSRSTPIKEDSGKDIVLFGQEATTNRTINGYNLFTPLPTNTSTQESAQLLDLRRQEIQNRNDENIRQYKLSMISLNHRQQELEIRKQELEIRKEELAVKKQEGEYAIIRMMVERGCGKDDIDGLIKQLRG